MSATRCYSEIMFYCSWQHASPLTTIWRILCVNRAYSFSKTGLTETWLKENNVDTYTVKGYPILNNYIKNKKGGDTAIYKKGSLQYMHKDILDRSNADIESVFIEFGTSFS